MEQTAHTIGVYKKDENGRLFDFQFTTEKYMPRKRPVQDKTGSIHVIIAKPTRVCNADCSYCSSPPLYEVGKNWKPEWDIEKFKFYFDKLYPYLADGAHWIWHGGEPMLLGPEFYKQAYAYAQEKEKETGKVIWFSMQSNLLSYTSKWYPVFSDVFQGALSSSFDPGENSQRTIKGNNKVYTKVFKRAFNKILNDGFRPMVIGVYSEENAHLMHEMYDWSLSLGDKSFPLRFNYCTPTGRIEKEEPQELIKPSTYADALLSIYERWIKDAPPFSVTPLDQMFKKVVGITVGNQCPWTKDCGGRFITIEPDGDIFNCSDFADITSQRDIFRFGNLNTDSVPEIMSSKPAMMLKKRTVKIINDCQQCVHFDHCQGGCMRDAYLFNHGLYGKYHYCPTWKRVFTRIKASIINGEADGILDRYGIDKDDTKNSVIYNIMQKTGKTKQEIIEVSKGINGQQYGF